MAGQIRVTPGTLRDQATKVRSHRDTHDTTILALTNQVENLHQVWEGEAQTAFFNNFMGMRETFRNFSEMLEGYARLMDTAATELETTDQNLRSQMQNFG